MAIHFIPNPQNLPFVHHKDHNRINFSLDNLEWITHKDNLQQASKAGRLKNVPHKKYSTRDCDVRILPKFYVDTDFNPIDEIWKDVNNFKGIYQVSNYGRIKSLERYKNSKYKYGKTVLLKEKLLQPSFTQGKYSGYLRVGLHKGGQPKVIFSIHRLVAEHFLIKSNSKFNCVNHLNGIKTDNRPENLEWTTLKENCLHALRMGLRKIGGENSPRAKLVESQVLEIRRLYSEDCFSFRKLSKIYNVMPSTINAIINRKTWKHI